MSRRRKPPRRSRPKHDWSAPPWLPKYDWSAPHLGDKIGWEIYPTSEGEEFFRGLPAILPADCNLCLEGSSIVPQVRSFLARWPAPHPVKLMAETAPSSNEFFHIPLNAETIEGLAQLHPHYAQPEFCDHLYAYAGSKMLIEWSDAFCTDSQVLLAGSIDEAAVALFADAIGSSYRVFDPECDDAGPWKTRP